MSADLGSEHSASAKRDRMVTLLLQMFEEDLALLSNFSTDASGEKEKQNFDVQVAAELEAYVHTLKDCDIEFALQDYESTQPEAPDKDNPARMLNFLPTNGLMMEAAKIVEGAECQNCSDRIMSADHDKSAPLELQQTAQTADEQISCLCGSSNVDVLPTVDALYYDFITRLSDEACKAKLDRLCAWKRSHRTLEKKQPSSTASGTCSVNVQDHSDDLDGQTVDPDMFEERPMDDNEKTGQRELEISAQPLPIENMTPVSTPTDADMAVEAEDNIPSQADDSHKNAEGGGKSLGAPENDTEKNDQSANTAGEVTRSQAQVGQSQNLSIPVCTALNGTRPPYNTAVNVVPYTPYLLADSYVPSYPILTYQYTAVPGTNQPMFTVSPTLAWPILYTDPVTGTAPAFAATPTTPYAVQQLPTNYLQYPVPTVNPGVNNLQYYYVPVFGDGLSGSNLNGMNYAFVPVLQPNVVTMNRWQPSMRRLPRRR
ncbi:hypothetical protein M514_05427 [Trichuris suis]|uniref:Uncharacterized protein n=1 Tax=Trichuris suis TaxID=68888 RepID=A0A085NSJ1_9BILA|nr:hypothetical protein M513_05427 [Trichuris suis]KFD72437.1 hypothetical protein M514_05427 [Trichuris suis]KHJ48841.1 hypothetical protein D918_01146 [Trichuris suis]